MTSLVPCSRSPMCTVMPAVIHWFLSGQQPKQYFITVGRMLCKNCQHTLCCVFLNYKEIVQNQINVNKCFSQMSALFSACQPSMGSLWKPHHLEKWSMSMFTTVVGFYTLSWVLCVVSFRFAPFSWLHVVHLSFLLIDVLTVYLSL